MAGVPQQPSQQVPQQAPQQQPGIMQQATDPLADLRDIHAPDMVASWPPAPGWWLLALIAAGLVVAGVAWLYRRWRANRYRREAMQELQQLEQRWQAEQDDEQYLADLQRLLKRVALTRFPREEVASLTGEAWVQFLDQSTGSHEFSMGEAEALIDGNYRPGVHIDVNALQGVASRWIRTHHEKYLREAREQAA